MVETSRPAFYTFPLQSDASNSGDALTYYDYQRAIQSKNVKTLQQLRERSMALIGAGRKPVAHSVTSRKIFQLLNHPVKVATVTFPEGAKATSKEPIPANEKIHKSVVNISDADARAQDAGDSTLSRVSLSSFQPSSAKDRIALRPSSAKEKMAEATRPRQPQTERLPMISRPPRSIKSASARDHYVSPESVMSPPKIPQRPNTVASTRDIEETQASKEKGYPNQGKPLEYHNRAFSEGWKQNVEELCKSFRWGTSTQRGFDELKLPEKFPIPKSYLPTTTVEQFPDPVSQRLTFRRYNSEPADWQAIGSQWDYVQTRQCDTYPKGPQAIAFCSTSARTDQIPGYEGYLPKLGLYEENVSKNMTPVTIVRTNKPRKTKISRRANIPGYSGQVLWSNSSPAHSNMPIPEPTTSARVHRCIPLEDEPSPFRKDGIFSKMVTTVSPHNPYNYK